MKYTRIFSQSLHEPFKTLSFCHLIQFTAVALTAKAFGWASMVPLSHLSCVLCEQVKFRPKKKVKMKVSYSVVSVETVYVCGGGASIKHNMNLISAISLI